MSLTNEKQNACDVGLRPLQDSSFSMDLPLQGGFFHGNNKGTLCDA